MKVRPSVVKVAAWGEPYVRSFFYEALPCLLAPNNLPALAAEAPVDLVVYTHRPIRGLFWAIPGLKMTTVVMDDVPSCDDLPSGRQKLAWTDAESVRIARERGADWFSFQADTLVSDGFMSRVKSLLASNLAVAGAPVRTAARAFRNLARSEREFTAERLRELSLRAMHPVTLDYFVREPARVIPADPHQFFFRSGDGFVTRTWQPCPYGVSFDALADAHVEESSTIDCHLIPNLPPSAVYFHKPTDDFYLTSLDDDDGIPTFGAFPMSASGIVDSIRKFSRSGNDLKVYARALEQRYVYPAFDGLPGDCADEETTIAEIQEALADEISLHDGGMGGLAHQPAREERLAESASAGQP